MRGMEKQALFLFFFRKKRLILSEDCAKIHPITHLSPVMACAADAVADHEKGRGGK